MCTRVYIFSRHGVHTALQTRDPKQILNNATGGAVFSRNRKSLCNTEKAWLLFKNTVRRYGHALMLRLGS